MISYFYVKYQYAEVTEFLLSDDPPIVGVFWYPTPSIIVVVRQATSWVIQFCQGTPHCGSSIHFIFLSRCRNFNPSSLLHLFFAINQLDIEYRLLFSSLLLPVLVQCSQLFTSIFKVFLANKQLHFSIVPFRGSLSRLPRN